jgi:hypothetical protein
MSSGNTNLQAQGRIQQEKFVGSITTEDHSVNNDDRKEDTIETPASTEKSYKFQREDDYENQIIDTDTNSEEQATEPQAAVDDQNIIYRITEAHKEINFISGTCIPTGPIKDDTMGTQTLIHEYEGISPDRKDSIFKLDTIDNTMLMKILKHLDELEEGSDKSRCTSSPFSEIQKASHTEKEEELWKARPPPKRKKDNNRIGLPTFAVHQVLI